MRVTGRTGFHAVRALEVENAPLINAVPAQPIDKTLVMGGPAGATPKRKPVNSSIDTTQIESGTQNDHGVVDQWVFKVFKAQVAVSSTYSSLIWKPKIVHVG